MLFFARIKSTKARYFYSIPCESALFTIFGKNNKTNPFRPQSDLIMKYFFFQINILSSKIYQSPSLSAFDPFDAILSVGFCLISKIRHKSRLLFLFKSIMPSLKWVFLYFYKKKTLFRVADCRFSNMHPDFAVLFFVASVSRTIGIILGSFALYFHHYRHHHQMLKI
jgi:hypothetical protein